MANLLVWAVDTAIPGSPQPAIPSSGVRYLVAASDTETWPQARARLAAGVNLVFITAVEAAAGYTVTIIEATPPVDATQPTTPTGSLFVPENYDGGSYNEKEPGTAYNGQAYITTYALLP